MHKLLAIGLIITSLSTSRAFASGNEPSEKARVAYEQAQQDFTEAETMDAKLSVLKAFLDEYPESEHTLDMIDRMFHLQGIQQGDMEAILACTRGIRERISDPELATDLDLKLAQMVSRAGKADDFVEIAEPLAASDRLSFTNHVDLIEAATTVGAWSIVTTSCERARRFANAEAYRSDYPGNVIFDADAEAAGRNRLGILLTYQGWANAHLGRTDEALADFEGADGLLRKNAFGIPDRPLYIYWGKMLMMQGKHREAFERLALDALIADNEEAHEAIEETYAVLNGGKEGFEPYALSRQKQLAKVIDDFTLPGFGGGQYSLDDLKGKVTVVGFWHPG